MKSLDMPQQVWLQGIMSYRCTTEAHAKALHKAAVTACSMQYRSSDYDDFMSKIAKQIGLVGLEIRRTLDEKNGSHVLGLVNTKGDEIAQLATTFTPHEIHFVKKMIEKIIREPSMSFCLGSRDAIDIASQLKPPIVATKAEAICDRLVKNGWLRLSSMGRYTLTPRALMELQGYLKSEYEDYILLCSACEELMTSGSACSDVECRVHVHRHCLPAWERSLKKDREGKQLCKQCNSIWSTDPVGEGVLASQYTTLRKARSNARRQATGEGSEEEDEEIEEEEDFHEAEEDATQQEAEEEEEQQQPRRKRRSPAENAAPNKRTRRQQRGQDDSPRVKPEQSNDSDEE